VAAKTYVLWSDTGPVAVGDLDVVKARGEKILKDLTTSTRFKWVPVEDEKHPGRLALHRWVDMTGSWINVQKYIDAVPVVAAKKKAGA
jgi:hypothetical protein